MYLIRTSVMLNTPKIVSNLLNKWKIISSDMLVDVIPKEHIRNGTLKGALKRMRIRGELFSLRVGDPWIYFHPRFVKRWKTLRRLDKNLRFRKFYQWGLDHHLKVVSVGRKLEALISKAQILANFGIDDSPLNHGTVDFNGKKYVPDLIVSDAILDARKYAFIEIERTIKEKSRYRERWLSYASDPSLGCCLYWVFDRFHKNRLENEIQRLKSQRILSSKFRIAVVLDSDLEKEGFEPIVSVFEGGEIRKANIREALFFNADTWTSHQLTPHQEYLKNQWKIKHSPAGRRADPSLSTSTPMTGCPNGTSEGSALLGPETIQ